jgi:transposase
MWTNQNRARYDRNKLRYPSDLTDDEWGLVEPLIRPGKTGGGKRTAAMPSPTQSVLPLLVDSGVTLPTLLLCVLVPPKLMPKLRSTAPRSRMSNHDDVRVAKPTRRRRVAGNRAPSSISRAINGCRTPSGRDQSLVLNQDAASIVRLRASQHLPHPRRAGADT